MGCGTSKKIINDAPSDSKVKTTLMPEKSRESYSRSRNKRNEKRKHQDRVTTGGEYRARFDARVVEKYHIFSLIGEGAFSKVVRVEDRVTKQPYAIKMIELDKDKEVFESELAVLRRVQHAYVVRLHELFECKNKVYLVMDLATGGELLDRIVTRGNFTEIDAIHVLKMVLEGVRYLHSVGITHRDLKPENLLYYHPGNDSKIMITDFGLSNLKKSPDDSIMETTCGTPEYIAPEILLNKPYTNSVDMWSIGVISYLLLSGSLPFSDDNRNRLYKAILMARYNYLSEPWNDVSDLAKSFIDKLLVLAPEKRMTAEEGLKHPWLSSFSASFSFKNLHGSISSNLLKSSSRLNSAKSNHSKRSGRSSKSGSSVPSKRRPSIPLHMPKAHGHQEKISSPETDLRTAAFPDSRKQVTSHIKLTRPLFEKLQSAVREERVDSPASVDDNTGQASTQMTTSNDLQINESVERCRESRMRHLVNIPPSPPRRFCDIAPKGIGDSSMLDAEEKAFHPFPSLEQLNSQFNNNNNTIENPVHNQSSVQLPRLGELRERDEDTLLSNPNNPDIDKTLFKPLFDSPEELCQMERFFNEGPLLSEPFPMDVDPDTYLSPPMRLSPRPLVNSKRNKISPAVSDNR